MLLEGRRYDGVQDLRLLNLIRDGYGEVVSHTLQETI